MNRVVHFEIPSANVPESIAFYQNVFGWTFNEWGGTGYQLITTGPADEPGIDGGLMAQHDPAQPVAVTIKVESVDATLEAVTAAGGSIALPKMAIQGVGWLAYFKDPSGYIFGVMQDDPAAA